MMIIDYRTIDKIERIKKNEKLHIFLRCLYICILIAGIMLSILVDRYYEFSFLIMVCLISTYIVSIISDCYKSNFDGILNILGYNQAKWMTENSEKNK